MFGFSTKAWSFAGWQVIAMGLGAALSPTVGWIVAVLGLLLFIPAVKEWLSSSKTWSPWNSSGFIPLREAAIKVFSESRARGGKLARHAENMSGLAPDYTIIKGDETQILNWISKDIAERITIFGIHPPSMLQERLKYSEMSKNYHFNDGGASLKHIFYGSKEYFTELSVRNEELNKLLKDLAQSDI